jgi:hypothetical protein
MSNPFVVVTTVMQIMAGLCCAETEKEEVFAYLNVVETIVHRPCSIIAFNDNGIVGRPLSESCLKPHHLSN